MSEHSASPRLEALESSVSEIQERMSELVGMLRQLTTETRTAGDGRRGEESGGARRDAAHIYSSGARRGPLTAATGYRVTAVQDEGTGEATAARNFPVHHRAASEPADTRPGLPTGVGPMIDVRSGEARDPYLAVVHARFVRALPDEYSLVKETLQAMKNRDRDEIIRMVSTRHSNLPQKKGAQRTSRQPEQAFVSNESGNRSGARRGRDRRNGGGQGRGRGGVGNNNSSGTPSGSTSSPVETQGSSDGAGSLGGGGDGRHHIPSGRCFRCRQRGHRRQDCTTRESDFVPRCNRCTGYGHEESSCSSDAAILVVELPVPEEDLAVEVEAFAVSEAGKCSVTIGDAVGGVALDKQVVQYIADSAATCNMTPDADGLTNYRECSRPLGLANGEEISIVGYGDLTVNFRTDHGWVRVKMNDVAHVPQLCHNLISLPSMTLKGHTYMGDKGGVTLKLKGGETVFFPLVGKLCRQYGFRPEAAGSMVDSACTTIAPGKTKTPTTPTDINILHCTSGHTHEVLLKKEQQGVNPSGELHECRGCSMARGLRKSIARSTHTGADTLRLSRAPAAAAPYCQRGGVYSGEGASNQGGRRVQGVDSEFSLGNAAEVWPPVLPETREALAAELGAGAAGVRKATPQHRPPPGGEAPAAESGAGAAGVRKATPQHRPPPGGEAPAAESGAGAAGVRKTTPRHHRPPPGGEAPAAESGAGAAGVRKTTPRHHRPPPGGEAPAAELGAGAAGVRKATPQHHRPPPGGEAPAAELGAGAAGARKATPRHHRPPSGGEAPAAKFAAAATGVRTATPRHQRFPPGGEAPAAKFAAAATGVRMATPRHQRFPPGGEAPAAKFAAAATGVRMATPRHQRFPPGGEAPAAKYVAAATGVRKVTPRHHRSPPGGPISVASTATVAATAARTAVPAATAAAATTVETFPPTHGDLRGTWRPSASSPYYRAATRGLSRGARPWERPARTTCWRTP